MKKRGMALLLCIALVFSSMSMAYAAESVSMGFDKDYAGTISETTEENTYGITLTESGKVTVTVMADMDALGLEIRDAQGTSLWSAWPKRNHSLGVISHSEGVNLTKGTYTLHAKKDGSSLGNYNLKTVFTSAGESFSEPAGGNNNSREAANPISVGKAYNGQFALNDKADWYTFTLEESGQLDFSMERECYHIYYGIYSADEPEKRLWYNRNTMDGGLWGAGSEGHTIHLTAGKYYFGVETNGERGGGNYHFETSFSVTNETCKEDNAGNDNDTILVADEMKLGKTYIGQIASNDTYDFYKFNVPKNMTVWVSANAERALGFRILDANGIEVYGKWTEGLGEKVDLAAGDYFFNVSGKYSYDTGDYQFEVDEYKLDQPKLSGVKNLASGVKVSWKAVDLATGYQVYRKAGSGSWKMIGTVEGGDVLSYTDKSAKSGTTYSYSVAAFNQDLTSTYHKTGKKIKRLSQPVMKIENLNSSVKVSWKKVVGASGYVVYKKAPGAKKWTKVKTIKASNVVSYTDKKVANGKTYTYTVKAYSGNYESAQHSGKKFVRLTTPKIKSIKGIPGYKAEVKWNKNSKASGYEVQYAKKKNFRDQNTMNARGTSTNKQILYLLEKGKTYRVKVRSYKVVNGVTYYSNWSSVKTKKITK